jgi:hypothetical protein
MIVQYLQDSGYTSSAMTTQDEANVKIYEELEQRVQLKAMRKAILGIPRLSFPLLIIIIIFIIFIIFFFMMCSHTL